MARRMFFPEHCRVLRSLGFKRAYKYRPKRAAETIACYEASDMGRKLSVQLWGDGGHRVSHEVHGRGITVPTSFRTVSEMRSAINHEWSREHSREAE